MSDPDHRISQLRGLLPILNRRLLIPLVPFRPNVGNDDTDDDL
ncbi:MAG: hypothetical protein ACI8XO_005023, partial [Verrucomicrobiales bacterium]